MQKILKEISSLNHAKACQETDKPGKIIKEDSYIFSEVLYLSFNASVNDGNFPSVFKFTDVTLNFKKDTKNSKDNYRPNSILKNLAKVFVKIMFKQIATFMDKYFSKFQCGFTKLYHTAMSHCSDCKMEKCC